MQPISSAIAPRSEADLLLGQALGLAARGLAVFPIVERGKVPLAGSRSFRDATLEPSRIQAWWRVNPNYNIGVATGAASGVWALDIDGLDGETTLRKLEAEHGALPQSVESVTGGGGRHVLFAMPDDGRPVRNSESKIGDNLDVRATGGFIVAPPSVHPSGRRYTWSVDSANVFAQAPAWLLDMATAGTAETATSTPPEAWRDLVEAGAAEGARNGTITRLAGHLFRRLVDPHVVLELLLAWNVTRCVPPLPAHEVERCVNSICGAEMRRRGRHG
jgi:hypothetical protein